MKRFLFILSALALFPIVAHAADPFSSIWAWWFPEAAAPSKEHIHHFNDLMNIIISLIVVFVGVLLFYTVWRFRKHNNPVPSKTTHNVKLEIVWTLIPCLILLIIVVPSLRLMYFLDTTSKPDLTLKVTGYQWYWGYSYPDQEIEEFSLNIVPDEFLDKKGEFDELRKLPTYQRLLSTYDLASGKPAFVVLPVEKNIRVLVTAGDVIHSFAMPAFGVKKDAVPGRVNETWFRIEEPGIYYGQCSEICGINHGYMPIEVRAVPAEQFNQWAGMMKDDSVGAMEYIQGATAQYAHHQLEMPHMTLQLLWDDIKGWISK